MPLVKLIKLVGTDYYDDQNFYDPISDWMQVDQETYNEIQLAVCELNASNLKPRNTKFILAVQDTPELKTPEAFLAYVDSLRDEAAAAERKRKEAAKKAAETREKTKKEKERQQYEKLKQKFE